MKLIDDIPGVHFSVWAPAAQRVSVVGDFNNWDGRVHQMRKLLPSGVWEIFLPGVHEGSHYKFEVRGAHGEVNLKTDPYAFFAQHGLETGCMVFDLGRYTWNDAEWMHRRSQMDPYNSPMSIYEVHLASWRHIPEEGDRWLNWDELADQLVPYAQDMGFTHLELLPISEHPFDGSWGYQTLGLYSPTARFGEPAGLRRFVAQHHAKAIGVFDQAFAAVSPPQTQLIVAQLVTRGGGALEQALAANL